MGQENVLRRAKSRLLSGLFDNVTDCQEETLGILADVDQLTILMTSLMEVRLGDVVSFQNAFSDLQ